MTRIRTAWEGFTLKYIGWIIAHPYRVLLFSLCICGMGASGLPSLRFASDYRVFFEKDNPFLAAYERMQVTYSKDDAVIIVLAPKDGRVFTSRTLGAVEWLTKQSWQVPYSRRVDSVTNFQYSRAQGDNLIVGDLQENAKDASPARLKKVREIAMAEPLLRGRLISGKGHVTAVAVTFELPDKVGQEQFKIAEKVRELKKEFKTKYPDIEVYLTGNLMSNSAFFEVSSRDMATLVPLMYVVILALTWIFLRSWFVTAVTFVVILLSILTALGTAGHMGTAMTPPSATAPTIIMTLAVADTLHIFVTVIRKMREGMPRLEALIESFRLNMLPLFLTSITSAVGFITFNSLPMPPFQDLGNITAAGIAAAYAFSILLVPALITLVPFRVRRSPGDGHLGIMEKLSEFVIARRNGVIYGCLAAILLVSAFLPLLRVNDSPLKFFSKSTDFRRDTDFTIENLTGWQIINYSFGTGQSQGISDPDYLAKLDEMTRWLREQPEVYHVDAFSDTMKRLNKNMHGDAREWHKVPGRRDLASQYLLLYEMSLPYGLDLSSRINVDKSASRMIITTKYLPQQEILAFEDKVALWLKNNAPASMQAPAAGLMLVFMRNSAIQIPAIIRGSIMALLLISLILTLALRSVRLGLISLIPNLLPLITTFGLWALFAREIDSAAAMLGAVAIGIIVDDTVHFLSKYQNARRDEGLSPADAVRYSFQNVGMALFITSTVLVAGFSILGFSPFRFNWSMGIMVAAAIVVALILDFLLLPALLLVFDKDKTAKVENKAPGKIAA